jgi:hypothetical protein
MWYTCQAPSEAALEPDLPIIDPRHHFCDTPQLGRYRECLLISHSGPPSRYLDRSSTA